MARAPTRGTSSSPGGTAPRALLLLLLRVCGASAQEFPSSGVNGFSLHPPYFNLAEGTRIAATATCGEDEHGRPIQDLYCKLVGGPVLGDPSQTIQGQYCDTCDRADSNRAHPITNAIDGTERWWQSPPLSRSAEYNQVNVTLDLGQLFHVAYVLVKFANSPRPDLWVLEHSIDFGKTYQPWQFFASSKRDCIERFGQRTIERINHDDDIICSTEYSRIVPLENGEIVVSLVNGRPGAMNFSYSPVLREFTKATNIRLRFLRTNTLLGHLMGKALRDPTVTRRYYYSIKDISIGGRCVCNGHAEACNAQDPSDPYKLQCDCQHNTCGPSCDRCCPGFNQLPWQAATTYSANECEPCNCHGHAFDCYYDPEVEQKRASLSVQGEYRGGGVCVECQHHTTGVNCEHCMPGYHRSRDHPLESPLACSQCECDSEFTDGTCEDLTGRCYCRPNYTGNICDSCAEGYENFPACYPIPSFPPNYNGEAKPAGEIINCECNAAGTEGNSCRPDPHTRTCVCKAGFTGQHCDTCDPGYYSLNCYRCQCSGPGSQEGQCDMLTGQCACRSGFQGYACDQCAPGYFNYPLCQICGCSSVGSVSSSCDSIGQCVCRPEFTGPRCEQCHSGFHSYPNCQECTCDPRTSLDSSCSAAGHCRCKPSYSGPRCEACAPGYYGYPSCSSCQCSAEGSRFDACDRVSGQCACLPNVAGQRCDTCSRGSYGFPHCHADTCHPVGSVQNAILPAPGSCECKPHVEGVACDECKPLYWNLSPDAAHGCLGCECNTAGTLSEVAECAQSNGQCYCKPNVCSGTCAFCKDGYFNLHKHSYFGCRGCQCDIGGSVSLSCEERSGRCQCRPNVEGPKCNQPRPDHYFPDLHHLKFEVEDGTVPDGRLVRFGYNPLEFEGFSWRGYAQMSPIQPRVLVEVVLGSPDLYRVLLRYVNRGGVSVQGRVSVVDASRHFLCGNCSEQSKQIVFAPSSKPTFLTVPQNSFVEPFVLNPGTWTVVVEAEGVLLDYLVLLPSAYYEAPILQLKVTEPCTYSSAQEHNQNCLLYTYLSLEGFPSFPGDGASCRADNHLPRPCHVEKLTPHHPSMAVCGGSDMSVHLHGQVPMPGGYVLVVEYASEDEAPQTLTVSVNGHQRQLTLLHCRYSFLCRAVSVDDMRRVAVFPLSSEADVQITADTGSFFLHKVFLIPHTQFTLEYLSPRMHCINTHGRFAPESGSCIPSRFQTPVQSLVLKEGQASSVPEAVLAEPPRPSPADPAQWLIRDTPPTAVDSGEHIRMDSSQNAVMYSTSVHVPGRYAILVHYHQPLHPTFAMHIYVNGGRIWQGQANATFCPHGYGCRSVLVSENRFLLDVTDHEIVVTVRVPDGMTLWLDYILVVPEGSYSSSVLSEEPLDKSYDFISHCGQDSFHINSATAPAFCRSSASSLSAFFNNGAVPCGCHEAGSERDTCQPFGGQCPCRPNVIGRDCSQCATGYYGFPSCRPCNCGTRLCEPVTGDCICPPRTLTPECVQCEPQTFGCHPLVGCEICNCSRPGVTAHDFNCDTHSGQCRCKANIVGRQCDRCAPGFYGYPRCRPCDCNEAGSEKCDPSTGQCLCKENVEGSRCDQCRLGTFYLDGANPKGCNKCFCFGATDRCRSSDKRRAEIMDMAGWALLRGDRQEVPLSVNLEEDAVEADLRDIPDVYQDLYWHAPRAYLGDKVLSYGGYLRYQLHTQTMRGDSLSLPSEAPRPDVILKGNQMTLVYMERAYPSPDEPHEGALHLVEGSFRHAQTGNAVSREELMMVLVALESLQVRARHAQSAQAVELRAAKLGEAGRHANSVEICMCPASYQGDSCQQCAPGYYRDTKGLFLGKCVPCNCNGHSDQCLDGSGVCVNCRHNTAGDHCEQCLAGYHGDIKVAGHAVSCTGCPCPLQVASNNFAVGCVEKTNHMQCLCMPGYAGPKCERCAPGYYGNPMVIGSTCQPCDCSGNSDPNLLFSECHPLTGECQGCMPGTAGPHCEACAPGFYGDALVAKNCTGCSCSPCGTASCNPQTGQCHCKPGVTGVHCDHCEYGMFGMESCAGCRPCECEAAAALVQPCDPLTGSCVCQLGVDGPHCRQCAPGFWGYSSNGCQRCDCKGGHCDPRSGACRCPQGLTGRQCDRCADEYSVPVTNGADIHCERCDGCVVVLLRDLDALNLTIQSVDMQLNNVSASALVWTQLHNLNATIEDVANSVMNYNSTLDGSWQQAVMLEREMETITSDVTELEEKASATAMKGDKLTNLTVATWQRAQDLLNFVNTSTRDIEELLEQARRTVQNGSHEVDGQILAQKLAEVLSMLRDMRVRTTGAQRGLAENELALANQLVERVEAEMANRTGVNTATLQAVGDKLQQIQEQLMELRDALNEAVSRMGLAAEKSSTNQRLLEENRQKVNDLRSKQKEVEVTVQMADDDITRVNDMISMLQDSKEDYERLAAQLDGARQPLVAKAQAFASSGSKAPLVEAAEEHAALLDQLATNLSSLIADTNQDEFIQRALNASRAYTNIVQSMLEAEAAAREANATAAGALEAVQGQDVPRQARTLRNRSAELEDRAERLKKELDEGVTAQLQDIERRLRAATEKKDALQKDVMAAVQSYLDSSRGNTTEELQAAKRAVEEANSTALDVLDTLAPIAQQLEEWSRLYSSSNTSTQELSDALTQANKSVGALSETIPVLMSSLNSWQKRALSLTTPNISQSILRVRQLIAEARKAASKVSVSMKFNGSSVVKVRTPSSLSDLASYTSFKFHILLPSQTTKRRRRQPNEAPAAQFVFYLGNKNSSKEFMGMVVEGARLRWLFNVGDKTAQDVMKDDLRSDVFHSLFLERILQYGQMSITVNEKTVKQNVTAEGEHGLLNLPTEETVFYVGGYPSNFTPPAGMQLPGFQGCIELESLNEEVISLYNFERSINLNTTVDVPCPRSKPTLTQQWVDDAAYFDGTGYAEITPNTFCGNTIRFEQDIKLISQDGILLLLRNETKFVCVAVLRGRLRLFYNFNGTLVEENKSTQDDKLLVSDGTSKDVELLILTSRGLLMLRRERTVLYQVTVSAVPCFTGNYFLGGVPEDQIPESLKPLFPKQGSVKGCFRNIKAMSSHIDLKSMKTSGVSYGCPNDLLVAREAHFTGNSYLDLKLDDLPDLSSAFYAGLGFRTAQENGLLLHHQVTNGLHQVVLEGGKVIVTAGSKRVQTQKAYNDENSHYVTFYSNGNGLRVYVDDVLETGGTSEVTSTSRAALQPGEVYLGGTPLPGGVANLTGCLNNLFINRTTSTPAVVDLISASENINVPLECPASEKPQQILASVLRHRPKKKQKRPKLRGRSTRESCQGELSAQEPGAYHFSGSHSHASFESVPANFSVTPHVAAAVRIDSSSGLIFHAVARGGEAAVVLSVSEGRLKLLVGGGNRTTAVITAGEYDDGRWHTVFVKLDGRKASLVVDGIDSQRKKVSFFGEKTPLARPVYVGGLPPDHRAAQPGFVGCVRDLELNKVPLSPSHSAGVVPCYLEPLQPGVYFPGRGGHIAVAEPLMLDQEVRLELEVRPVSDSGLLLHAGAKRQQLSLYLSHGRVTAVVKSGGREFPVSLTPEVSLCDGNWHNIVIEKTCGVITLRVDALSEHGKGPSECKPHKAVTLYLGNMPGVAGAPSPLARLPPFHGCVRNTVVNGKSAVLSKPLSLSGAVGTQGCPAM
ncbi:laminin subunit alpha-5 isoform X2 [Electrophorus electricus]|uniref:laminin subunit alpha-5 isoform X2 n=1 Tax=Electrophorus electricus TaxID=8005 RepID=UPI0015D04D00|nr:laminin subunit alpha-5 isoform X2 [Electrophorus electricus]